MKRFGAQKTFQKNSKLKIGNTYKVVEVVWSLLIGNNGREGGKRFTTMGGVISVPPHSL